MIQQLPTPAEQSAAEIAPPPRQEVLDLTHWGGEPNETDTTKTQQPPAGFTELG